MSEYIFDLNDINSSNFIELRQGDNREDRKFARADSLYVLDNAFYFFLEFIFQRVIEKYDMFEDTYITKEQWQKIMRLDIDYSFNPESILDVENTLSAINKWVEGRIPNHGGFTVIGV